ncbi:TetR/AcrR family transcriptional regulator [Mycobacterium sp.]|uniref:TetR/AcrR family transcriptional regulator n=1 Tax=Mycobacterium sp. TaxID=1785 RepID=UPI003BAD70A4
MTISTVEKVLDAAEHLIHRRGYDGFSMADLVSASGVSNGSVYHHFGTKDGVLGALLLRVVENYQNSILIVLDDHPDDPEQTVHAIVTTHLQWTESHPRQAKMLLEYRHVVTAQPYRRRLQALNHAFLDRHTSWLQAQVRAGRIPDVDIEAAHAMVFAPAQELSRRWLTQRSTRPPTQFASVLGAGAWAAMSAANKTIDVRPNGEPVERPAKN